MTETLLTGLLLAISFPVGYAYGQKLKAQNLDVDTAFSGGARPWAFLFCFLALSIAIALVTRFPRALPPHIMIFMEPMAWILSKAVLAFFAGLAIPLSHTKPKHYAPALVGFAFLAIFGTHLTHHYFLRPIPQKKIKVRIGKDDTILQSTGVTCVAASFANAMRLFNIETTEKEAALILGTRDTGTTDVQLLSGLDKYGLYGHYVKIEPAQIRRMNRPTFISIDLKVITHSVLVYGHDDKGNLFVVDPISGKTKYTEKSYLEKLYDHYGIVVTPKPLPHMTPGSPKHLIREMQQLLQHEGLLKQINGTWDESMTTALKHFQKKYQVPQTGRLDEMTYLLLTGPQQKRWDFGLKELKPLKAQHITDTHTQG